MSTTYDNKNLGIAVGNAEKVLHGASIVSASKTPFLSTNKRIMTDSVQVDFLIDDRADPNRKGAVEGKDVSNFEDPFKDLGRGYNFLQRNDRTAIISWEQSKVKTYSKQDAGEIISKRSIDLNIDVEASLLSNNVRGYGDMTDEGRTMSGLANLMDPSSVVWADNMDRYKPTTDQYISSTDPTEVGVLDLVREIHDLSGETDRLRCYAYSGWVQKFELDALRIQSNTGSKLSVNIDGKNVVLPLQVKIFQTSFGIVEIFLLNPKTSMRSQMDSAYFVNPDFIEIHTLQKPIHIDAIQDKGAGNRWLLRSMNTVINKNPRTSAYWASGA